MKYEDLLQEGLDNCLSEEKRRRMIEATIEFCLEMKSKVASDDPEEREEARRKVLEIQALLIARKNAISEMIGLSPDQIDDLGNQSAEHEVVAEAKVTFKKALSRPKRPKEGIVQV
jgi:hypothetical protein